MEAKKIIQILILLGCFQLTAQNNTFEEKMFVKEGDTLLYRIQYPNNFVNTNKYPVLFFLHGAGERGNDNKSQLTHGSSLFSSEEIKENFPAIIIFPQCPKDDYWASVKVNRKTQPVGLRFRYGKKPTKALGLVMDLIDETLAKPYAKEEQVYIMGLSMGGMGTYELLYRRPNLFAAAVAICGGGKPKSTKEYATKVPLWAFHGSQDNVVDPILSLDMTTKILEYGGHPKLTLYDFANHNSWDPAFAEPELLPWLFSNTKQNP